MKQVVLNYSFSVSGLTVTLSDFTAASPVDLKRLYLIVDVTTNQILYNFADSSVATATISSNNVITLSALPTGPANGDSLQIIYDLLPTDPVAYEVPLAFPGSIIETLSGWTSATTINTTQNIYLGPAASAPAIIVSLDQTSTISGGAISFQATYDGTNWSTVPSSSVVDPTSANYATIALPYTLVASTNKVFMLLNRGWQGLRIILSTAITGTATVTPYVTILGDSPVNQVVGTPTGTTPPPNAVPIGINGAGNSLITPLSAYHVGPSGAGDYYLAVMNYAYNGQTGGGDATRTNMDNIICVAAAAYTSTQTQADQTNPTAKGIMIVVNVTSAGTGSITPEIDVKDPVSSAYVSIMTASAAIVANGTYTYLVYPGAASTAGTNNGLTQTSQNVLTRTWRVKVTANNANSVTYSVGAMLIN
jgi:hypothetical protein